LTAGAIAAMGVASAVHARRKRKSRIAAAGLHDRLLDSANDENAAGDQGMTDAAIDDAVMIALAREADAAALDRTDVARESAILALTSEPLRSVPAPKLAAKSRTRAAAIRPPAAPRVSTMKPIAQPSRNEIAFRATAKRPPTRIAAANAARRDRAIELLGSGPAIAIWIMLVATAWLALPKSWVTSERTAAVNAQRAVATSTMVATNTSAPAPPSREELLRRVAEDPLSVRAYMPIEDVREGDLVVARDDATGELVARPVTQLFRNTSDHLREVTYATADGATHTIATTDEHPFWTESGGWTPSKNLESADELQQIDGDTAILLATLRAEEPSGVAVYNFEVEGAHNYFVAPPNTIRGPPEGVFDAVLVHNQCQVLPYENGGGHHIFAKRAFEGLPGYSKRLALAIPDAEIRKLRLGHLNAGGITATQQRLFRELAASGRRNTLEEHARIAREALIKGGLTPRDARNVVTKALQQLHRWEITAPARIPWN
jgi:hypothetical protein